VGQAGAVRVAVDRQADVGALLRDACEELVDVRRDGLGVHPSEIGVPLAMKLDELRLPAADQAREVAARAPEQRLDHDLVARALEGLEIEELGHAREVFKGDRKSTRLNSSHVSISYAVFCLKKKKKTKTYTIA